VSSVDATVDPSSLAATGIRWLMLAVIGVALVVCGEVARRPFLRARGRS
jgi:hypothetical protein